MLNAIKEEENKKNQNYPSLKTEPNLSSQKNTNNFSDIPSEKNRLNNKFNFGKNINLQK